MNTDLILHKYMRHLRQMDRIAVLHIDTVELALRLALDELGDDPAIDLAERNRQHVVAVHVQFGRARLLEFEPNPEPERFVLLRGDAVPAVERDRKIVPGSDDLANASIFERRLAAEQVLKDASLGHLCPDGIVVAHLPI